MIGINFRILFALRSIWVVRYDHAFIRVIGYAFTLVIRLIIWVVRDSLTRGWIAVVRTVVGVTILLLLLPFVKLWLRRYELLVLVGRVLFIV